MPTYNDPTGCLDREMKELIAQIPDLENWEWKKTLRGGFSAAAVFLAWTTYRGGSQALDVFKFDSHGRSKKEHANWQQHVNPFLDRTNIVPIKHFITGKKRSLIVYGCGSFDGHLETFAEHYAAVLTPEKTIGNRSGGSA